MTGDKTACSRLSEDRSRPRGLKWRSSMWFVTTVVGLGVTTDLLVYSLIVPIIPFQLENLDHVHVSSAYWLWSSHALQGVSSTVIWVAGLALLCDSVPESSVGRQLGIAMNSSSAPRIRSLYDKFGFHGPFIFGIIITAIDLIGRLLVIERKHAILWASEVCESRRRFRMHAVIRVRSRHHPALALNLIVFGAKVDTFQSGTSTSASPPGRMEVQSSKVGLVYIAAVVPTYSVRGAIRSGQSLLSSRSLHHNRLLRRQTGDRSNRSRLARFSLPWILVLIVQSSLPLFIVVFALANFGVAGTVSPLTAELAAVTRQLNGVGYAHLYDHLARGWMAICLFGAGSALLAMMLAITSFGDVTVLSRIRGKMTEHSIFATETRRSNDA
ncbi:uncharacterized protein B0H18DRAFT_1086101 [Fomitopsis serialis]|uniref:uncharacterized protein n=1 Tax=Fomitopsis serialis TaxID=139415 RepID=UPI002008B5DD|nr:uncharacterized protein B0H18DRAFT_1086101 [Neoantrodia serialis]KAH9921390.1 hypothetical protein B0H18DRAFT_1086101 [Neoantrodia serialis]